MIKMSKKKSISMQKLRGSSKMPVVDVFYAKAMFKGVVKHVTRRTTVIQRSQ